MVRIHYLCYWMGNQTLNVCNHLILDLLFPHLQWSLFIKLFFQFSLELLYLVLWICFQLIILLHLTHLDLEFQRFLNTTNFNVLLCDLCFKTIVKILKHLWNFICLLVRLINRYKFQLHLRPEILHDQLHEFHREWHKLFSWPPQIDCQDIMLD